MPTTEKMGEGFEDDDHSFSFIFTVFICQTYTKNICNIE